MIAIWRINLPNLLGWLNPFKSQLSILFYRFLCSPDRKFPGVFRMFLHPSDRPPVGLMVFPSSQAPEPLIYQKTKQSLHHESIIHHIPPLSRPHGEIIQQLHIFPSFGKIHPNPSSHQVIQILQIHQVSWRAGSGNARASGNAGAVAGWCCCPRSCAASARGRRHGSARHRPPRWCWRAAFYACALGPAGPCGKVWKMWKVPGKTMEKPGKSLGKTRVSACFSVKKWWTVILTLKKMGFVWFNLPNIWISMGKPMETVWKNYGSNWFKHVLTVKTWT